MPSVTLSYKTEDFIEAQKLSTRQSWRDKKRWALLALGSVAAVALLTCTTEPPQRGEMLKIASLLMPSALIGGLWLSQRVSIALHGRRALTASPALRSEFTYEVQPEGLIQRSQHGEAIVKWTEVQAVSEDRKSWLIYPAFLPAQSYLLPKRCLTADFQEALKAQLMAAGAPRK